MYQFTTTTVINSATDAASGLAKYAGTATDFTVRRVGKFLKTGITSVYKRLGNSGTPEVATITIPNGLTIGATIRLTVDVRLSQSAYSDFASAFLHFRKPIVVEVLATGVQDTDALNLKKALDKQLATYGSAYIKTTDNAISAGVLPIRVLDTNAFFYSIVLEQEKASTNSIIQPEYDLKGGGVLNGLVAVGPSGAQAVLTTKGIKAFGDEAYMIKAIQVPSAENARYFGINKEERPIVGGIYDQFTLRYEVTKDDIGIVSGAKSITTHVFYVLNTLSSAFETELTKAFPGLITVQAANATSGIVLQADTKIGVGLAQTTVVASGGKAPYSFTSGTTSVAVIDSATGVVEGKLAGSTVITVTDANSKTATITITVA